MKCTFPKKKHSAFWYTRSRHTPLYSFWYMPDWKCTRTILSNYTAFVITSRLEVACVLYPIVRVKKRNTYICAPRLGHARVTCRGC
jgi:hypothetical protein